MKDYIDKAKVKLELYIINNKKYTDYDIGEILYSSNPESYVSDDACEVCNEIAEDLYKTITGEYKCVIEIKLEYISSYYYFEGWEYDMDYSYKLINKEKTNYWKEGN